MKIQVISDDLMLLPEYQAAKSGLIERGKPWEWMLEVVDTTQTGSAFLKKGKPWYRSDCPYYEGYWLNGGNGAVQCTCASSLLPGIHQLLFCEGKFEKCPLFSGATEKDESNERK